MKTLKICLIGLICLICQMAFAQKYPIYSDGTNFGMWNGTNLIPITAKFGSGILLTNPDGTNWMSGDANGGSISIRATNATNPEPSLVSIEGAHIRFFPGSGGEVEIYGVPYSISGTPTIYAINAKAYIRDDLSVAGALDAASATIPICYGTTQYLYYASATNCAGLWMDQDNLYIFKIKLGAYSAITNAIP